MKRWMAGWVAVLALATAGACGGGDDDGAVATKAGDDATSTTAEGGGAAAKKTSGEEVPAFLADLKRVCTTQVGFLGLTAYEAGAGGGAGRVHPVALFEDYRGAGFIDSSRTLPAGWQVEQDGNYADSSELKAIELVACSDRTTESPTGVVCTFDGDKDEAPAKLELVDATYEVKVYAATTGELVHSATLEAKNSECPFIATFKKGDKTFVNEPSDDDYIGVLKAVVTP